ncbi:rod shape-determining protein MreC [Novosphingobium mangrovi (ex Huang et al. 2023)]|uniref:Cell shape-determining protein MreC n=1 Tax=Novosphingobium mangrovi (ex Huang et al. 2023) TaxID=2976432 RepID=A0ABT2I7F1_9SPHN|nr:rod shape-determining protein MreC [Novosphingobium mangrovi (ex Huang et al. 2023)]MCT2400750.1 rod shape-determining protein MreC [Novosphingobium mangrovi (ex Huang et al. 2023)]
MAPPANRRSGFSRRAQYSTFFSYAAGVIGAVVGAGLIVVSIVSPEAFSGLRSAATDVTEPAGQITATGRSYGKETVAELAGFFTSGKEHARLERELAEAKTQLVEAKATKAENQRLKRLLALKQDEPDAVAFAHLTRSSSASTRRFATIDAGRSAGLAKGMPVRSATGLVGRVLKVGEFSALVLLITDTESLVPVRRARDGVPAFAQGNGDGTIRVRLINLGINPLKKGDVMVSSGSGGLYRPGTPMAIVTEILRDGAIARVLSNPSDTDFVMVEKVWAPEAPPPPDGPEAGSD